jgi:hypothetical protein
MNRNQDFPTHEAMRFDGHFRAEVRIRPVGIVLAGFNQCQVERPEPLTDCCQLPMESSVARVPDSMPRADDGPTGP